MSEAVCAQRDGCELPHTEWTWAPYGNVAAGVHGPDGELVAIIGYPLEKELAFVRDDLRRRDAVQAETRERDALGRRFANIECARLIADALNTYTGELKP